MITTNEMMELALKREFEKLISMVEKEYEILKTKEEKEEFIKKISEFKNEIFKNRELNLELTTLVKEKINERTRTK